MARYPCLPLIEERFLNFIKDETEWDNPEYLLRFQVYTFPQIWGSTALGFGGIGGSAMTTAYTTVIKETTTGWYGVFFDEKLAYAILNPNQEFFKDLHNFNMETVSRYRKYKRMDERDESKNMG